jgi:hypothetical protein
MAAELPHPQAPGAADPAGRDASPRTDWARATWGRLPILAELAVYVGLGLLWALPFRRIFRGVGQADPEQADPGQPDPAQAPGPADRDP